MLRHRDESGAITVKRTKNAKATTVSIHSAPVLLRPDLNLEENPYLYFDLTQYQLEDHTGHQ